MKNAMISTWKMSYDGMVKANDLLQSDKNLQEAIITLIQDVEQREEFISVGHGGLPNELGQVQLDSAYMNGNTLGFGGVIEAEHIKSPIEVAAKLSELKYNCLLSGKGAEDYAREQGYVFENHVTAYASKRWTEKKQEHSDLKAYEGHDTVCVLGKQGEHFASGVSTSGLFMKHAGRVGDSPIIGSGFYSDAFIGSAAATGLGEDIMRGCLSIRIVDQMAMGKPVQEAVDTVLDTHIKRMKVAGRECDSISLIAMDKEGNCGASTNNKEFPYVVLQENQITLMVANYQEGVHTIFEASEEWIKQYQGD